jgi:hypothetical protein
MTTLSRRELLRRGAGLALATSAGSLVALDRLWTPPAHAGGLLRKGMSMSGSGALTIDGHPDDYRLWGNREYIRDLSGTKWVKIWVSWYDLQQELELPPQSRNESWRQLNTAPGGASWLRRLDHQIRAANDDRVGVIVGVMHDNPTWATGATGNDPVYPRKPASWHRPLDASVNSPWGWFIAYLCARYARGVAPNPIGPHALEPGEDASGYDPLFGNPEGAWMDALEVLNEPNYIAWPQEGIVDFTAEQIKSAATIAKTWRGPLVLVPGMVDFPDAPLSNDQGIIGTWWFDFTQGLLQKLKGFNPEVPMRWSHHNYRDVKLQDVPTRAERIIELLRASAWIPDPQPLWITESGINMGSSYQDPGAQLNQARVIERNFFRMMRVPEVFLWMQHGIHDKPGNNFHSGLRNDFVWGSGPGTERPAWYTWKELPGSPIV